MAHLGHLHALRWPMELHTAWRSEENSVGSRCAGTWFRTLKAGLPHPAGWVHFEGFVQHTRCNQTVSPINEQQTCVSDAGFSGQAGGPIRTSMITEHAQNKLFQKGQDLGFDPHLMWFLGHLPHELFINFSSARACVDGDKP